MLTQNFKTAADLELSERQRGALIKTLVLMETGQTALCSPFKLSHWRALFAVYWAFQYGKLVRRR